jgi:hypothetical protein
MSRRSLVALPLLLLVLAGCAPEPASISPSAAAESATPTPSLTPPPTAEPSTSIDRIALSATALESIATVRVLAAEVAGVNGDVVGLEATTGTAVGDDVSELIEQTPDAAKEGYEYEGVTTMVLLVDEDPRLGGDAGMWGLAVAAENDVVTTIGIPFSVNSGVDC